MMAQRTLVAFWATAFAEVDFRLSKVEITREHRGKLGCGIAQSAV